MTYVATTTMGPHLMLDCRKASYEKMADVAYVFKFLYDLPEKIGMTKITQPYVFPYSGLVPEDEGVTGVVVIAESHLTFHSFIKKDYFFFDLFSCKPFDVEATERYVLEAFDVKEYDRYYTERGRDFPRKSEEITFTLDSSAAEIQIPERIVGEDMPLIQEVQYGRLINVS
jgi:S-adenosylmethionine decarboxylase